MKDKSTYFLFGCTDLIELFTSINKYTISEIIQEIEDEDYGFTLYEYDPEIDNPAIILYKFTESREKDYTTLTKEEFNILKEI
jgi:hypothetical protein